MKFVFLVSNVAFPGKIKIGVTSKRNVDEAVVQLSRSSATPRPFKLEYSWEVPNAGEVKRDFLSRLRHRRDGSRRDFINISVAEARRTMQDVLGISVTPREQRPGSDRAPIPESRGSAKSSVPTTQARSSSRPLDPYAGKKGRLGLRLEHTQDVIGYLKKHKNS